LLYEVFAFSGGRTVRELFGIYNLPWAFAFGVTRSPLVVSFQTIFKVVCRADIIGAVLEALQYVNIERHEKKKPVFPMNRK